MEKFELINVAFGGVQNRNNLIKKVELKTYAEKWKTQNKKPYVDCYATYFRYPQEMLEHFDKRKSVSGYDGSIYADYLPIDIDSQDLIQSQQSATNLLLHLESQYEVDMKTVRIYFSGCKGFHIELPSKLFGFEPSPFLHEIFRNLVKRILPDGITVDEAIYDKVRLWRLKNTINSKSGLYKIPLSVDEVFDLTISEIQELAKTPREGTFYDPNISVNAKLNQLYLDMREGVIKQNSEPKSKRERTYKDFFKEGAKEGNRHHSIISLVGMLKTRGVPLDEAVAICLGMNRAYCQPPKEDEEVIKDVKDIYARYENPEDNGVELKTTSWTELIGKEEPQIQFLIEDLLPCGNLILLGGKPKLGKSLLALLCALSVGLGKPLWSKKVTQGGVLFVSTEDGEIRLKKRIWKMLGNPVDYHPDFHFYCGELILNKKNNFDALKRKIAEIKPSLIVLDPLINLFRGKDLNKAEDMNEVLRPLQELAKESGACVLVICHARKSAGEDPLDIIQGSITIGGVADGILLLKSLRVKNEEKLATLEVILKDAEVPQKVVLKLDDKLRWNVEGNYEEVMNRNLEEDLEKALTNEPNGLTIAILMQILGIDYYRLYRVLQSWEAEKKVSTKQVGKSHTKVYSLQSECKAKMQSEKSDVTNGNSSKNKDNNPSLCKDTKVQSESEKNENLQSEDEPDYLR